MSKEILDSFDKVNKLAKGTTAKAWLHDKNTQEFMRTVLNKMGVATSGSETPEILAGLMYALLDKLGKEFDAQQKESIGKHMSFDEFDSFAADPMYSFERDSYIGDELAANGVDNYMNPDSPDHFNFKALADVGKKAFSVVKGLTAKKQATDQAQAGVAAAQQNLANTQSPTVAPVVADPNSGLGGYLQSVQDSLNQKTVQTQTDTVHKYLPYVIILVIIVFIIARKVKVA